MPIYKVSILIVICLNIWLIPFRLHLKTYQSQEWEQLKDSVKSKFETDFDIILEDSSARDDQDYEYILSQIRECITAGASMCGHDNLVYLNIFVFFFYYFSN